MAKSKYQRIDIQLSDRVLPLYVGARIHDALEEVALDMPLYKSVRLSQVLEAAYEQGMKDGRREIIEKMDGIKQATNYLPPGRPKNKTRRS